MDFNNFALGIYLIILMALIFHLNRLLYSLIGNLLILLVSQFIYFDEELYFVSIQRFINTCIYYLYYLCYKY